MATSNLEFLTRAILVARSFWNRPIPTMHRMSSANQFAVLHMSMFHVFRLFASQYNMQGKILFSKKGGI